MSQVNRGGRAAQARPAAGSAALAARHRLAFDVRALRKAHGMTQRQLAARSGVQQAEISRIEAGRANPTLSTLALLGRALDAELALARVGRERADGEAERVAARSGRARASGAPARRTRKFLCLVCAETLMEEMSPAEAERHLAEYRAFTQRLRRRGQLLECNRLLPADTAVTVRVRAGRAAVTDGPFAETKELVGGYFVVEARDRAEALRLAARIPGARIGSVEVRPIADDPATLHALGLGPAPDVA